MAKESKTSSMLCNSTAGSGSACKRYVYGLHVMQRSGMPNTELWLSAKLIHNPSEPKSLLGTDLQEEGQRHCFAASSRYYAR